jgi:alanine dehydrogenase
MIVGVVRETKSDEYRVGLLPVGAQLLVQDGHTVLVEKGAGIGSGFEDQAYAKAGVKLVETAAEVWARSEMVIKVKEPQSEEIAMLRPDQILFCYFHFAAARELTEGCLKARIASVAYETLYDREHRLPLLTPMSEVAGKMAVQEGAKTLERPMKGRGILLGGVSGVAPADVVILGGGVVGTNAAWVAAGMGANVTIMDVNLDRLRQLDSMMPANVTGIYSDPYSVNDYVARCDLVIGAVLIPGRRAPSLITRQLVSRMRPGSVLVDVAIDQGGCAETSRPTTHREPTYTVDDVVHYCVTNMPGAVSRTSSQALCNATLPYARELARLSVDGFIAVDPGHAAALNTRGGKIANRAVAETFTDLPAAVKG